MRSVSRLRAEHHGDQAPLAAPRARREAVAGALGEAGLHAVDRGDRSTAGGCGCACLHAVPGELASARRARSARESRAASASGERGEVARRGVVAGRGLAGGVGELRVARGPGARALRVHALRRTLPRVPATASASAIAASLAGLHDQAAQQVARPRRGLPGGEEHARARRARRRLATAFTGWSSIELAVAHRVEHDVRGHELGERGGLEAARSRPRRRASARSARRPAT